MRLFKALIIVIRLNLRIDIFANYQEPLVELRAIFHAFDGKCRFRGTRQPIRGETIDGRERCDSRTLNVGTHDASDRRKKVEQHVSGFFKNNSG